jgi:serine/threonine protein kinase
VTESGLAHIPDLGPRFEWLCHLGEGGYGRVELAFDSERTSRVALKLLPRALHGGAALKHEFRILRDVASPNLVSMLELIIEPKLECLVLEYVDGVDLLAHLGGAKEACRDRSFASSTLPTDCGVGRCLPASFLQLLDALAFLDRAGLVHGDLKPANIFVESGTGRVVVLDFGIARLASAAYGARAVGTPLYMAPEQFEGAPLTGATDRYALGVLLYRALSGRFPHVGTALQLERAKRQAPPPLGSTAIERIASELLEPDPSLRPSIAALRAAFGPRPAPAEVAAFSRERAATPLVGRREELTRLKRVMQESPPSVALLVGRHGKTAISCLSASLEPRASCSLLRGRVAALERDRRFVMPSGGFETILESARDGVSQRALGSDCTRKTRIDARRAGPPRGEGARQIDRRPRPRRRGG